MSKDVEMKDLKETSDERKDSSNEEVPKEELEKLTLEGKSLKQLVRFRLVLFEDSIHYSVIYLCQKILFFHHCNGVPLRAGFYIWDEFKYSPSHPIGGLFLNYLVESFRYSPHQSFIIYCEINNLITLIKGQGSLLP